MTYGEHLAAAAATLAQAYAALKDPPPEPSQRAVAALARIGIYRSLEQHTVVLGGVNPNQLPPTDRLTREYDPRSQEKSLETRMAMSLRRAAVDSVVAARDLRGRPTPYTPVAIALDGTKSHLQAAADILISNVGRRDRTPLQRHPHTPDGLALLAGVGRDENLALVARLVVGVVELDRRLARWLWPEEAPRSMRELLDAAENDAWRTRSGTLHGTANLLVDRADPDHSPLVDLTAAPPVDDPQRWQTITSRRDCVHAVDAARSWLLQNGAKLTAGQLATIGRAAAALVHFAGYIHAHTGGTDLTADHVAPAMIAWRTAAQTALLLRSAVHPHTDHTTATVALTGAAHMLHERLRPSGEWPEAPPWRGDETATARWRQTGHDLLARMPDLADLASGALIRSRQQNNLLALAKRVVVSDRPVHARWKPVKPNNQTFRTLRGALLTASDATRNLTDAARVTPRPGLAAASTSGTRSGIPAAHLAAQWYLGKPAPTQANPPHDPPRRSPTFGDRRRSPRISM